MSTCLLLQPMTDKTTDPWHIFLKWCERQDTETDSISKLIEESVECKVLYEGRRRMGPGFSSVYSFLDACILLSRGCCERCRLIRMSSWARCSPVLTAFHSASTQCCPSAMLTHPSPTQRSQNSTLPNLNVYCEG